MFLVSYKKGTVLNFANKIEFASVWITLRLLKQTPEGTELRNREFYF